MGAKNKKRGVSRCSCSSPFPVHLAVLGLTSHVCLCGNIYLIAAGTFQPDGREDNPFSGARA